MLAYKFLDHRGRAPFTDAVWRPDVWMEAAEAAPCRRGLHGCRAADVSHWLGETMWQIELAGPIVESRHKVVGQRGRLVAPVEGYADASRELAEVSAFRCRDRAVELLRSSDQSELAARFEAAATVDEMIALGPDCDDADVAGRAAALASDAAYFAVNGNPSQSPFVAACSAGHAAAAHGRDRHAYDGGYDDERTFQATWLTNRLGL